MPDPVTLTPTQARRIALIAQGFARRQPEAATRRDVARLADHLGVLQIDSVNVLARAHLLPGFSRLGAYDTADLDVLSYGGRRRRLFEYWGHEASLMPVGLQPLLRWRMARAARGEGIYGDLARFGRERADIVAKVRRDVLRNGPLSAADLDHEHKGDGGWWGWSEGKRALEWLFWAGEVTTATRRGAFERVYDLTERVLPQAVLDAPTPDEAEAQRALLRRSAAALGIATARCLRDYYRLDAADAARRLPELVEAGDLIPAEVKGWGQQAYLWRDAPRPRRVEAQALLAPFDPLIWQRERTENLFGVRVRLEIYTPAEKRTHGYYVLPFLMGEHIVARVDLKADRAARTLRVQAAHGEPGHDAAEVAPALAAELARMAAWLGLGDIAVEPRGDLAAVLSRAVM
jgi:uncharacterized protein YcaQ